MNKHFTQSFALQLMLFFGLLTSVIRAQTINTIAGGLGDGGAATMAPLYSPQAVAIDASGNLYIADYYNNRIRKVTAATGVISTVAGNGSFGFSGDGGAATAATLNNPQGVAVDAGGNIYLSDTGNNRIRKVTAATGIISTIAGNGIQGFSGDGGVASAASLNNPAGLAVDAAGNVYIADPQNNRVRKVTAATSIISTIAGNGTAAFSGDGGAATTAALEYPQNVTLDVAGNIYIVANNRIRKVIVATGIITTVAGNGSYGFSGDGGAATAASLNNPVGVALDTAGNMYIADSYNCRIRKVTASTGIITTVMGNGTGTYSGDGGPATAASSNASGVAVDAARNIYIVDSYNHRIRKITASSGVITTIAGNGSTNYGGDGGAATAAVLYSPRGFAFDAAGNAYFADTYNHRIRKITAATGVISTVAGDGTQGFSGDGGAATFAKLNNPFGVAVDATGNIYIADTYNHRIRKITAATGVISTVAGNGIEGYSGDGGLATAAAIFYPYGIATDVFGDVYLTDTNRIRKITSATGIITTVVGVGTQGFSGDGGPATSASLNFPNGVALDAARNIFIADSQNNIIRKVTAVTGIITTVAGNGAAGNSGDGGSATTATLNNPTGIAIDAAGNMYIMDSGNNRVRKVTASTGIIITVVGNGTAGFSGDGGAATAASLNNPFGIAIDTAGSIFISDTNNNRVRKVTQPPLPTITSFTPTIAAQGTTVTITGTNFTATMAVSFGGIAATSYTVVSDTTITAVVGSGASGNVSVTTPGGIATLAGFVYCVPVTPTFTTVSPICSGATLSNLPTTSNNNITGTWTPALDNTTTTTYTFTPTTGQCATTATMTITVTQHPTQPTVACYQTATFNSTTCSWEVMGTQPTQPTLACYQTATFNGTTCSWEVTGTQPTQPEVACYQTATFNTTTCSWVVTGTAPATPVGEALQNVSVPNAQDATIGNLVVSPSNAIWYASMADALAGTNALQSNTVLTNGATYYAVNMQGNCPSTPLAVMVNVTLKTDAFVLNSVRIFPNPTSSVLYIQTNNNVEVDRIVIYDLMGKTILTITTNYTQLDVANVAPGMYLIEVRCGAEKLVRKFVKE